MDGTPRSEHRRLFQYPLLSMKTTYLDLIRSLVMSSHTEHFVFCAIPAPRDSDMEWNRYQPQKLLSRPNYKALSTSGQRNMAR